MPFVQGRLRNENLSFVIQTECGHCHQPLQIEMDSELNFHLSTPGAEPVIYSPLVDFGSLEDPSIIDAF